MNNIFPTKELKERLAELEEDLKKMDSYRFSEDEEFASKLKGFFSHQQFRRSGRTFLLLRILIESSIENDTPVNLFDHFDIYKKQDGHLQMLVHQLLHWYNEQGIWITMDNHRYESIQFKIRNGFDVYNKIRINTFVPQIQEERQFSKLLLIL